MKRVIQLTESELNDVIKKVLKEQFNLNELNYKSEKYLDKLLDKISTSGMDSLTPEEKEAMNKMSSNENVDDPEVQYVKVTSDDLGKFRKKALDDLGADYLIEFSLDFNGEVEYVENIEDTPYSEEQIADFLYILVKEKKLPIHDRTEGSIEIGGDEIILNYKLFFGPSDDAFDERRIMLNRGDYDL